MIELGLLSIGCGCILGHINLNMFIPTAVPADVSMHIQCNTDVTTQNIGHIRLAFGLFL